MHLAATHPAWALGFEDETWWSRRQLPPLSAWAPEGAPLRLIEQSHPKTDPGPKALACYGLLLQESQPRAHSSPRVWLRFVRGRPVSALTIAFLLWVGTKLQAFGKTALLLVWDNASWHKSQAVRRWLRAHNQPVKREATGVRIVACRLPTKSPWLNPLEAYWGHGKRAVVEPDRLLSAQELAERVCAHFGCPHEEHLSIPEKVL
jgi:hypothetical protein